MLCLNHVRSHVGWLPLIQKQVYLIIVICVIFKRELCAQPHGRVSIHICPSKLISGIVPVGALSNVSDKSPSRPWNIRNWLEFACFSNIPFVTLYMVLLLL